VAEAARRLRASQDEDDYRVVDMEAHWPALGAAKGWVGTPIFDGSRYVAILLIRFPIEPIEAALNGNRGWEAEGLGKTGEVYLVGPDLTLRTNSRFFLEDKEAFLADLQRSRLTARTLETIRRFDSTALFLPVTGATVQAAFRGEHGVAEVEDYRGIPVLSAYGPLDLDSLRWAVLAERDMSELQEPLRAYARKGLATAAGLALVSSLMAMWLSSRLTRPISQLATAARRVSQGDMSVAVETFPEGEYRALGEAFNEMVASLRTNREALDRQAKENERLLVSLLPASGAAQMRDGNAEARQAFADVTVAFVNLVGFEELAHEEGDGKSMDLLSEIVASCDEAAEAHGVEKVRTIGSSYLAVSGLSVERPDHTERMVAFAREVVRIVKLFNAARGTKLVAEIGINAGPVVGGLVGRRQFIYDVWGDTVKLARGIESDGHTSIMVTRAVHERVRDLMPFDPPTTVEVRGMGSVELFSLTEEAMA
jgi:class 3 adenylate cyclase